MATMAMTLPQPGMVEYERLPKSVPTKGQPQWCLLVYVQPSTLRLFWAMVAMDPLSMSYRLEKEQC